MQQLTPTSMAILDDSVLDDILLAVNGEVSSRWAVSFTDPRRQLAGSYAPRWELSVVTPTSCGRPT